MTVGLLGGGVIGGGWAARFVLNGIDVRLYDPDPDAPRKVGLMLENARHALGRLTYAPLPAPGELTFVALAALAGGNVRVGLEDNLYLSRGRLASNGELVERAVHILEGMNARVLAADEVRDKLRLRRAA